MGRLPAIQRRLALRRQVCSAGFGAAMTGLGPYIPREDKLKARASAYSGLAAIYWRRGEHRLAKKFLRKALSYADKLSRL